MTTTIPDHAFILAAGMGKRLRPHTDTLPKPLVPVDGKPMIDHTMDRLAKIGVRDVTVNLHYRADQLQDHLTRQAATDPTWPRITFSHEDVLMDTGGGIKKALYTMGDKPFYVFSGDTLWEDGVGGDALIRMAEQWAQVRNSADLLLLLQPVAEMTLTHGSGDYDLDQTGNPVRNREKAGQYFWPSVRICHPRLFDRTAEGAFSFLELMDRAEAQGRLAGLIHDGVCHHITAPEDLAKINAHYAQKKPGPKKGGPKVA